MNTPTIHEPFGPFSPLRPSKPNPRRLPEMCYPAEYRIRTVCAGGQMRWCGETAEFENA